MIVPEDATVHAGSSIADCCFCLSDFCRDRQHAPFRCLEAQYRRELVRVYLTNVETLARKFVEEKREALAHLREDNSGFRTFWGALDPKKRRDLATASGETILKVLILGH